MSGVAGVNTLVEMTLSANLRKATAERQRLQWRVANDTAAVPSSAFAGLRAAAGRDDDDHTVVLRAREIRTYLLDAQPLDPELSQ